MSRWPTRLVSYCNVGLISIGTALIGIAAAGDTAPWSLLRSDLPAIDTIPSYDLPAVDLAALLREDALLADKPGPLRVGAPLEVDIHPGSAGRWESLSDGGRLWRVAIESPGALWLSFGFGNFHLQSGAELRIFDPTGVHVLGPYTAAEIRSHGQLWTPPLAGDRAILELYWPAALGNAAPAIHLGTVSHGYKPLFGIGAPAPTAPDAGSCEIDVNCPLGANWQDDKHGVVALFSNGSGYCSASLIADSAQDCKNYVLTAHHCQSTEGQAASTVFRFNFERPNCGSGTPPTDMTVSGATQRATSTASDFTLLEMSSAAPEQYLAYFNGWSRSTAPASEAWGIHHPGVDEKKISHSPNPLVNGSQWGTNHWRVNWWSDGHEGVTEGGSSGSPLFDPAHHIVGQLHGGGSACGAAPSDMWDEYGKVAVSWEGGGTPDSRLRDWLDADGTGALTQDGYYASTCAGGGGPRLSYLSAAIGDPLGNQNDSVDPAERVSLALTVENKGGKSATSVAGTLTSSTPGVTVLQGNARWPDIPSHQTAASLAPHFTIQLAPTIACGAALQFHLTNTANEGVGSWNSDFTLHAGQTSSSNPFSDNMENGNNGWSPQALLGRNSWSLSDRGGYSGTHSWAAAESILQSDSVLIMKKLTNLGPQSTLQFQHRFSTENNYDGGVLEYSIDAVHWIDAGSLISSGGYNSSIVATAHSTIAGRNCWAGDSQGWTPVTLDLSSLAGNDLTFRWRFVTNDKISVGAGWAIDDVVVSSLYYVCNPVPPGEAAARDGAAPLKIAKQGSGYTLDWSAPTYGASVERYKLYRTPLAVGAAFQPQCEADLGTALSATLATLSSNQGFVVVARNGAGEGSYGQNSAGAERSKGSGPDLCP